MRNNELPAYLSVSEVDGALYDTSNAGWYERAPLRPNYRRTHREINTVADLLATLRNGAYAWPGCYPMYLITDDSATIHFDCAVKNLRSISDAIRNNRSDGWRVIACDINHEDNELYCDHCGKLIESACGEGDANDAE